MISENHNRYNKNTMSKKEKMTIIGNSFSDLAPIKNEKREDERLYARRSINVGGYNLKLGSKLIGSDFGVEDIKANKDGKIVELELINSKGKKTGKIRLKNTENLEDRIKTVWKQESGNIFDIDFPKNEVIPKTVNNTAIMAKKIPKIEETDKKTVGETNEVIPKIQKAPEKIENTNESVKKHILITKTEKKQKILEEILSKKTEINAEMPGENLEENRNLYELILQKFSNPQDEEEKKIIERATKKLEKITEVENLLEQFQALSEEKNISRSDETKKIKKLASKETLENIR